MIGLYLFFVVYGLLAALTEVLILWGGYAYCGLSLIRDSFMLLLDRIQKPFYHHK